MGASHMKRHSDRSTLIAKAQSDSRNGRNERINNHDGEDEVRKSTPIGLLPLLRTCRLSNRAELQLQLPIVREMLPGDHCGVTER
jgi:hypothetical protein